MYDYVRPENIMMALKWLKANNPLYYSSIDIYDEWVNNANTEFFRGDQSDVVDCGDFSTKVHVHVKILQVLTL